jgi:5-methyltetrahydropteroyltriglutamate--homocysteine methyltransferase
MLNVQEVVDAFEIQDPSIFDRRADQKLRSRVSEIYQSLVGGVTKEKHLITYFFLDSSSLKQFFDLPVDVFGLDMIEGRNKMRQIYPFVKERRVYLGVLDSRTTKMERVSSIKRMASRFSAKGASDVIVGFNSFTDFIPEIVASRKVRLLGKVKKA